MRFLFISPYDERCVGLRSIGALLHADGHEVHFLHIEGFLSQFVRYDDPAHAGRLLAENPLIARDIQPLGDLFVSSQECLDETSLELLVDYAAGLRPDAVGISVWVGLEALGSQVTEALRRRLPGLKIIWGGTFSTLFPEAALERCELICVGQGELALQAWAAAPQRRDIPGLWVRAGGEIHQNGCAPAPDLDALPYPLYRHNERTLTDGTFSMRQMDDPAHAGCNVVFSSSRYCRFDCAYCLSGRMRRNGPTPARQRKSVDRFLGEIEHAASRCQLPETITFWDDNFADHLEWIREFAEKYPRRIGRPFSFNTHPAHATREAIELLVRAGAEGIALGLQSGSERILREVYQRTPDVGKLIDLAHFIQGLGVTQLQIDTISNNPFETDEDCRATFETILKLPKPCDVHLAKLVIYPGSKLAAYQGPRGGLTERDFDFWNMLYFLAGTGALSESELRAMADDRHLREQPWILRQLANAVLCRQEEAARMQQAIAGLHRRIAACDHMLKNSCHKSLGAIVRDKVRYRLERWRGGKRPEASGDRQ